MSDIKIIFTSDYSPRQKGEVVELEKRLAEHYMALGVAKVHCEDCPEDKPCENCEKASEAVDESVNMVTNESFTPPPVKDEENKHKPHKQKKK